MKTDFTNKQIEIMFKIIDIEQHDDIDLKYIEREVGEVSNYDYDVVIKYLIFNKILVNNDGVIKIEHKKLRDLIDEQKAFLPYYTYLNQWHLCNW